LRAFNQLHAAVLADGALSAKLKELSFLRVAILNGCEYWTRSHTARVSGEG